MPAYPAQMGVFSVARSLCGKCRIARSDTPAGGLLGEHVREVRQSLGELLLVLCRLFPGLQPFRTVDMLAADPQAAVSTVSA